MTLKILTSLSLAALMLTATSALARDPVPQDSDTFELHSEVGEWKIYKVMGLGTCVAERVDADGNVIQMGLTKKHKHGYIGVFTLADIDIKNRQKVEIDIDGAVFDGKARGIKTEDLQGDYSGGYIEVKDVNFATAIAEGEKLTAFPKKTGAFSVDLTGTKKAIEEGRKCNLEMVS